ncbi:shikimate kinase [Curtobacterium sp. Leaf261]|uniref:shikimate kinase n=1 Tax=Curtobacterium sp. Leaf261 TaxID=1736311 RepID=UPI000AC6335C
MSEQSTTTSTAGPAGRPVVIIGPMGAGKSSVGKRVAKALGLPFTDTDRMIVRSHGPISGIFAARGETEFRALEAQAVADAMTIGGVISVGGGAVTHGATREALAGARIVLLTVSPEAVAERISGTKRPLLATGGIDAWTTIADERAATYAELAHVVVDTSRRPMSRVVEDVVAWVRAHDPESADTHPDQEEL